MLASRHVFIYRVLLSPNEATKSNQIKSNQIKSNQIICRGGSAASLRYPGDDLTKPEYQRGFQPDKIHPRKQ